VDWYVFHGDDGICETDPTVDIDASEEVRLCIFIECDNKPTSLGACPGDTDESLSDEFNPGCCGTGQTWGFELPYDCAGGDDSATVTVRVDQAPADTCVPYLVEYHF
jgi:hypothetical protein